MPAGRRDGGARAAQGCTSTVKETKLFELMEGGQARSPERAASGRRRSSTTTHSHGELIRRRLRGASACRFSASVLKPARPGRA